MATTWLNFFLMTQEDFEKKNNISWRCTGCARLSRTWVRTLREFLGNAGLEKWSLIMSTVCLLKWRHHVALEAVDTWSRCPSDFQKFPYYPSNSVLGPLSFLSESPYFFLGGVGVVMSSIWILVRPPGLEPASPAMEAWSLGRWTTMEVPSSPHF